jgi:hypothetical protein
VPTGGRALRRTHQLPLSRLCSIARPRYGRRWEHGGRTRNLTSRHAQRTRLTFASGIAGGCQQRAPTTWRRGGTAAQQGRQGGCAAASYTSVRHNAWVGQGAWFTPRCRAAANLLTPHSPSMLTSLVRLVLSQSTSIAITTAYELEGSSAGVFGSILIDSVLLSAITVQARCCERGCRRRCGCRACAAEWRLLPRVWAGAVSSRGGTTV